MADGNVVPLGVVATPMASMTLEVPLHSLERTAEVLSSLEVAVALALAVVAKAPVYGDQAALAGVRQVFAAVSLIAGAG